MKYFKKIKGVIVDSAQGYIADESMRLGASLAYYSVFSLAPLLVIAVGVASIIFGTTNAEQRILQEASVLFGRDSTEMLQGILQSSDSIQAGGVASLIGFALLLFGAGSVFKELQDSLNHIFSVKEKRSGLLVFIMKNVLSFGMVLATGFLLLISLVLSVAVSVLSEFFSAGTYATSFFWETINITLSFLVTGCLFALIFRFVPACRLPWRAILPSALVTASLFTLGKTLLAWYLSYAGVATSYGASGSLVLILLWVYYSAQILFFGAELVATLARTRKKS